MKTTQKTAPYTEINPDLIVGFVPLRATGISKTAYTEDAFEENYPRIFPHYMALYVRGVESTEDMHGNPVFEVLDTEREEFPELKGALTVTLFPQSPGTLVVSHGFAAFTKEGRYVHQHCVVQKTAAEAQEFIDSLQDFKERIFGGQTPYVASFLDPLKPYEVYAKNED